MKTLPFQIHHLCFGSFTHLKILLATADICRWSLGNWHASHCWRPRELYLKPLITMKTLPLQINYYHLFFFQLKEERAKSKNRNREITKQVVIEYTRNSFPHPNSSVLPVQFLKTRRKKNRNRTSRGAQQTSNFCSMCQPPQEQPWCICVIAFPHVTFIF